MWPSRGTDLTGGKFKMKKSEFRDWAAYAVIALTVALFVLALYLKGFTHDLLLEGAVFLVSAKLILMAKKNADTEKRLEQGIEEIKEILLRRTTGPL
jgi:hypothetical protein